MARPADLDERIVRFLRHHGPEGDALAESYGRSHARPPGEPWVKERAPSLPVRCAREAARLIRSGEWRQVLDKDPPKAPATKTPEPSEPPAEPRQVEDGPAPAGGLKLEIDSSDDGDGLTVNLKGQALVMNVDDLVREASIDLEAWRIERHRVNTWTTTLKGPDGDPQIVRNWQVRADLQRRIDADIKPVVGVALPRKRPTYSRSEHVVLGIPDSQHGYHWDEKHRRLIPLHDRAACDLAVQAAKLVQPDTIVLMGDMVDFAEVSTKFPTPMRYRDTLNPVLREMHWWLAQLRMAAPAARIVYLEGNHEARLVRALTPQHGHLTELRGVNDASAALAIPRLLDLPSLEIEYVGPYGSGIWVEGVFYQHGDKVRGRGGATSQSVCAETSHSVRFGHIHRVERASKRVYGPTGARQVTAATAGCLCSLEIGRVPGFKQRQDWQQALELTHIVDGQDHLSLLDIHNGRMELHGRILTGDPRTDEISAFVGWDQIAA